MKFDIHSIDLLMKYKAMTKRPRLLVAIDRTLAVLYLVGSVVGWFLLFKEIWQIVR